MWKFDEGSDSMAGGRGYECDLKMDPGLADVEPPDSEVSRLIRAALSLGGVSPRIAIYGGDLHWYK